MAEKHGESVAFSALYGGNLAHIAELLKFLRDEKKIRNIELAEELLVLLTGNDKVYNNINEKQNILKDYCNKCRHNIRGKVD